MKNRWPFILTSLYIPLSLQWELYMLLLLSWDNLKTMNKWFPTQWMSVCSLFSVWIFRIKGLCVCLLIMESQCQTNSFAASRHFGSLPPPFNVLCMHKISGSQAGMLISLQTSLLQNTARPFYLLITGRHFSCWLHDIFVKLSGVCQDRIHLSY